MPSDPFPPLSSALPATHPSQIPNPHHRPIELQSPSDLAYLRTNITCAATARLDLHFPPSASTPTDPMRSLVHTLVQRYLNRTLALAAPSISVNGNPLTLPADIDPAAAEAERKKGVVGAEGEGLTYTLEPYDAGLSTRLAALYAELERETLVVSRLRKRAPKEAAEREGRGLVEALGPEEEEERLEEERLEEERLEEGERQGEGLRLGGEEGEWEERQALYEDALGELRRMVGGVKDGDRAEVKRGASLMETVGKVQRARDVVTEFE